MAATNPETPPEGYTYPDRVRPDIIRMIPADGRVIGSIGCGLAKLEGELVKQGREVHGVDISPEAIAIAKTRITTARVVQPDERVFFEDNQLDGLILADVIEHLPLAWDALKTYARAVKPGGWVVISVPNMRNVRSLLQLVAKDEWPEDETGIFDSTHLQVMTFSRLVRWANAANLRLERWFDYYVSGNRFAKQLEIFNKLTFRKFNGFLQFQVQGVFRKV